MALNLYFAVAYEGDGKDDSCLLVRASHVEEAAQLADAYLCMMPFPHCEPRCTWIAELGTDGTTNQEPGVVSRRLTGMGLDSLAINVGYANLDCSMNGETPKRFLRSDSFQIVT